MRIDQICEIDLDTVTLSDIQWQYGTGISTASGNRRKGTYKPGYRHGVMTSLGDILEDIWYQVAEHIASRDGEVWLVEALTIWEETHNYTKKSPKELYHDALHVYASRVFDDPQWVGYIPFNRVYRPNILKNAQIIPIVNSCCGKAGDVTQQQIERACNGVITCPHCGRWSTFFIIDDQNDPPWQESQCRFD